MRLCIILVWLVLSGFPIASLNGQNQIFIDSLINVREKTKDAIEKVKISNELAFQWKLSNPQKAIQQAEEALSIAKSINYQSGESTAYVVLGLIQMYESNYIKADSFLLLALDLRIQLGIKSDIAGTYNNLGISQYDQGNDSKAVFFFKEGLKTLEGEPLSKTEAMLCNNIADSYIYLGDYKSAIDYISQSIAIREQLNDRHGKARSLLNLGYWYLKIENVEKAIENSKEALTIFESFNDSTYIAKSCINLGDIYFQIGEYKTSTQFFDKAVSLQKYLEIEDVATLYQNLGNLLEKTKDLSGAMEAFNTSMDIYNKNGFIDEVAKVKLTIGSIYFDRSEYQISLKHLQDSQEIADESEDLSLKMQIAQMLSEAYTKTNQTELALKYSRRYNRLKDSISSSLQMAMNYKIDLEEAKTKNAILEKENASQLAATERKNLINISLITGIILWTFLSIAIIIAYKNQRKRRVAELKVINKNNEIDTLLKEQQLKTTYAKLAGQDEERKRIGQDLHDRIGGILSTVKLYLKGFDEKLDAIQSENKQQFTKANDLLDEAVVEVRKIAKNIHSGILTKFGLKAELENLAEMLNNSNRIQVKVVTHGLEKRLPVEMAIKIYRIIQELVSNVLKHAGASKITIQVNEFKDVLNVVVEDNGIGFDPEKIKDKGGMGLKNIESRVYDLHGTIIIDSGRGNGASVAIDVPIE